MSPCCMQEYIHVFPPDPESLDQVNKYFLTEFKKSYLGARFVLPMKVRALGNIGIMEKKMEATIMGYIGIIGVRRL